jgi:hypothetical protein
MVIQIARVLLRRVICEERKLELVGRVHPEGTSLNPEIFGIEGHPEGHPARQQSLTFTESNFFDSPFHH